MKIDILHNCKMTRNCARKGFSHKGENDSGKDSKCSQTEIRFQE